MVPATSIVVSCAAASDPDAPRGCAAGDVFECACVDGRSGSQVCNEAATLGPCECGTTSSSGTLAGGGSTSEPAEPAPGPSGTPEPAPAPSGTAPEPTATATTEPPPPEPPPPEPPPPEPDPTDPFDALRQACVDHINMYRQTLGLDPLARASHDVELCSDSGAEQDATTGGPHSSFGQCSGMSAQNTCPGWDVGRYGSEEAALRACLDRMWAEGEPPEGRAACIADINGCFQEHGHYLNMSSSSSEVVSCGFYRMPGGELWMNQDFGR